MIALNRRGLNDEFKRALSAALALQVRNITFGLHWANEYDALGPEWTKLARSNRFDEVLVQIRRMLDSDFERNFDKTQSEWSPDCKCIVFVGDSTENTEIYTIEPDGENLKQITSNHATDAAPHWSRDGKFIIFISESAGTSSLCTMDKDGDKQKRIMLTPYIFESDW